MQFQILSTAPDETAKFYSRLFDWKINPNNPLGYRQIDTGSTAGIQARNLASPAAGA